jgi:hypothetical protein
MPSAAGCLNARSLWSLNNVNIDSIFKHPVAH